VKTLGTQWLEFLEQELQHRRAKAAWQAGEDQRTREQFFDKLEDMARKLIVTTGPPLNIADLSPAEQLAINWFWPEPMRPEGLPSGDEILAVCCARMKTGSG
jgi:hypothetical protein